jgi:hypothetical protein
VTDVGYDGPIADGAQSASMDELKALTTELRKLATAQAKAGQDSASTERSMSAMANLAEGIQGLVKNMRNEQQMLRDWIEAQQEESKAMRRTLDRLSDKIAADKIGSK